MPVLSSFTPFGLLEFSSEPSEGERLYTSIVAGYRDPKTGAPTIDTTLGTHQEAKLYGWAMALGSARASLRRAANELRGETSYELLESHERKFKITPGASDSVAQRRVILAARQKAARGPRYESIFEALSAILGDSLIAYRPIALDEAVTYPESPQASPGTFPRTDRVGKSIRLLTSVARLSQPEDVADSYPIANLSASISLQNTGATSKAAQSFTGNGRKLGSCHWALARLGAPSGHIVSKIYAHAGSYGGSSIPTGDALATSEPIAASTLTTSAAMTAFDFRGANRIVLTAATKYVLVLEYADGSSTDHVAVGTDSSAPTHLGNAASFAASAWTATPTIDCIFSVDTPLPIEVSYENWNRSLVEQIVVPGDVLCVDAGNWGLADRATVLESSGAGATRKLVAAFTRPHSIGAHATTAPMPLWISTKRHVLIVVDAAASVDPVIRARVNDTMRRMMRGPTTWDIVQPTSPGASTLGPFKLNSSPLGAVPITHGEFLPIFHIDPHVCNPAEFPMTGWWRAPYTGSPAAGIASVGPSGGRALSNTAFTAWIAGSVLNGYTTARSDGIRALEADPSPPMQMTAPGTFADYASAAALSGWLLVKPTAGPLGNGGILFHVINTSTGGLVLQLSCSEAGALFKLTPNGGSPTAVSATPIALDGWNLITFRYDGAHMQIGINEIPGTTGGTSLVYTSDVDLASGALDIGLETFVFYFQATPFAGDIAEAAVSNAVMTDDQFRELICYIDTRYALSF